MDIFGIKETKNSKEQQRIVGSEIHPDYQGYLGNQGYGKSRISRKSDSSSIPGLIGV